MNKGHFLRHITYNIYYLRYKITILGIQNFGRACQIYRPTNVCATQFYGPILPRSICIRTHMRNLRTFEILKSARHSRARPLTCAWFAPPPGFLFRSLFRLDSPLCICLRLVNRWKTAKHMLMINCLDARACTRRGSSAVAQSLTCQCEIQHLRGRHQFDQCGGHGLSVSTTANGHVMITRLTLSHL